MTSRFSRSTRAAGCSRKASKQASSSSPPAEPSLWATVNGKPALRPLSWRGWKTRNWIALLSGTILEPSRASSGATAWLSSLPASRASRGAAPARASASAIPAGSGPTSPASFATYDPTSSSWKTSQDSLFLPSSIETGLPDGAFPRDSASFSETWPRWGGMRNGSVFRRPPLELITSGGESSSGPSPATGPTPSGGLCNIDESPETFLARAEGLKGKGYNGNGAGLPLGVSAKLGPTPDCPSGGRRRTAEEVRSKGATTKGKRQIDLESVVPLGPTPKVARGGYTYSRGDRQSPCPTLLGLVGKGPTPKASDGDKAPRAYGRGNPSLPAAAENLGPTPQARDTRSGKAGRETLEANARPLNEIVTKGPVLCPVTTRVCPSSHCPLRSAGRGKSAGSSSPRLNPAFVSLYMGWPWWWTRIELLSFARREMASWRSRLRSRLSSLVGD